MRTSVRRIHFALASGCPNKVEFEMAHLYLRRVRVLLNPTPLRKPPSPVAPSADARLDLAIIPDAYPRPNEAW